MRPRSLLIVFALLTATLAFSQSNSPEALYDRGIDAITGVGPAHNDAEGIDYFRRSAEVGYGPAQIALGYYYETGTVLAKDPAHAVDLYRKAAQTGDPLAAWLTGRLYFLGSAVPRDLDTAQKWLKMSAGQNNAYGAYFLGRLMADRDAAKAPALFKLAADQGLPQAQYYYGKALKDGNGIAQDRFNAYVWLQVAADAGYNAAGQELAEISGTGFLGLDQIADAKAKARELEQLVIRAVTSRGCSGWDGEFDDLPTPPPPKFQRFCH
jgi:uncharacterized protein